ncbi:DUF5954 family protein [Streptomyces sp. NPDC059477]|uniref:DUF5954 family protein n=1 Tax=Streptomyces sp. NPDC059477 TaxID=3346847 RepID=UPI00367C7064
MGYGHSGKESGKDTGGDNARGQDGQMWPIVVRQPQDPVEAVMEADAYDASLNVRTMLVRGPLFGVAAQDAGQAPRWRVVIPVAAGFPQEARDSLNSRLWDRARNEARNQEERRALLAAVDRLERERVDELTVLGTRYRVVRAEEYAGEGPDGIEQPRPTDPEPADPDWERATKERRVDADLVLDPEEPITPVQAAERLMLRDLEYTGKRFPQRVRDESRRALRTHPDVLLMPAAFRVVEGRMLENGSAGGWQMGGSLHTTAHDARRALDFSLTWFAPRQRGLIPWQTEAPMADARTVSAEGDEQLVGKLAEYVRAADRLRAERANQVEIGDCVHRICRARRLLRWGPDGPEGPRPTDTESDPHPPSRIHPRMDEDGVIHYDEEGDEGDDD